MFRTRSASARQPSTAYFPAVAASAFEQQLGDSVLSVTTAARVKPFENVTLGWAVETWKM